MRALIFVFLLMGILDPAGSWARMSCSEFFQKLRRPYTPEEKEIIQRDKKALGFYRFLYKLGYDESENKALGLLANPKSFLEPSPKFRDQVKDYLAAISHLVPSSQRRVFSESVLQKAQAGAFDNTKSAIENIVMFLAGRPIFQAYPRFFTKVVDGKSHDLVLDLAVRKKILSRLDPEAFTRNHMKVTSIEKGTLFKSLWVSLMAVPVVFATKFVKEEFVRAHDRTLLLEQKPRLLGLLVSDFRYHDILQSVLDKGKSPQSLEFGVLEKVYARWLELDHFDKWVLKHPKIDEVDSVVGFREPLFRKYDSMELSDTQKGDIVSIEMNKSWLIQLVQSKSQKEWMSYLKSLSKHELELQKHLEDKVIPYLGERGILIANKLQSQEPLTQEEGERLLFIPLSAQTKLLELQVEKQNVISQFFLGKPAFQKGVEKSLSTSQSWESVLSEREYLILDFFNSHLMNHEVPAELFDAEKSEFSIDALRWQWGQWIYLTTEIEKEIVFKKYSQTEAEVYSDRARQILREKILTQAR